MAAQDTTTVTNVSNHTSTIELVLIGIALFGSAFAVARAAFERKLPYTAGAPVPNPWRYRPPVRGYTLPGGPQPWMGGSPKYEIKIQGRRDDYEVVDLEQSPGDRPVMRVLGTFTNKNEALYKAGLFLQAYARNHPNNSNVLRILDDRGRCVYAIRAFQHDPGFVEVNC
jgi:hypothetical protein